MFFRALDEKKHISYASDVADNFKAVNCNFKFAKFKSYLKIFLGNSFNFYFNFYLGFLIAACAAAKRAIGTLYGEQDT